MRKIIKPLVLLGMGIVSPLQAATTFLEGARDTVTLHPSCRTENTGLTAIGVALPVGPVINATISSPGADDIETSVTLPLPSVLMTTDRSGNEFGANPIMGARPSFNQSAIFGSDIMMGTVATYGRSSKEEDTKMVFWKVKGANSYDMETNTLTTLPYIPAGELVTVELGFALPKFTATSCLKTLKIQGAQIARCDQIDPATKQVLADSEPDLRQKRTRLTVERNLEKNPLPASCGEGMTVTVSPTDAEVDEIKAKMATITQ